MSIAESVAALKQQMAEVFGQLQAFVDDAAAAGRPIHEVERGVWQQTLRLGNHCLATFLALQGDGDMGATIRTVQGRRTEMDGNGDILTEMGDGNGDILD
jgi:hypothetical protein